MKQNIRSLMKRSLLTLSLTCALWPLGNAQAEVAVGATLPEATVRDANDKPATIPDFGSKVVMILYTDPNVADQNDPFADKVKAAALPTEHYKSIGIANMKDAPGLANFLIRMIVRSKIKKYNVTILTDPDRLLPKAWDLGDCNDKSVAIIIDHNKKLRFLKKGALNDAEKEEAIALLRKLIAEKAGG